MEQIQVLIKIVPDIYDENRYRYASLELYVDGDLIGDEYIGGEPEDNTWCRDYAWIAPLMETLAKKLGANATIETEE